MILIMRLIKSGSYPDHHHEPNPRAIQRNAPKEEKKKEKKIERVQVGLYTYFYVCVDMGIWSVCVES